NPSYLINDETKFGINNTGEIIEKLKTVDGIKSITTRLKSIAMVSSATTGTGILLNGIDIQKEIETTNINNKIVEGSYFEKPTRNPIVIGKKLADKLKVKIGSKIVVTLQNMNEDITYGAFKIVGIYKTDNTNFDLFNTFTQKEDLNNLLSYKNNEATEIAILLNHNDLTDTVAAEIKKIFAQDIEDKDIVIRSWKEIQPMLQMMNEMTIQFTMIFVAIILFALSFGIINTMLMAIMERVREIGMLMAIGMSKIKVFLMIMMETIFLSITGGILGIVISWILVQFSFKTGIDLSAVGEGLNSWGYSSFIRPELDLIYYFMIALLVIFTAIFASILPARKALKLIPSEAVRQDI
ncbi:MAG: ABC transporter permease, partial [Ignavibacteriae bacterium]|nr:ABC transporter permease [Ignavibacteriota bacterium]